MKKILLTLFVFTLFGSAFAQTERTQSCYQKYAAAFEKRGAHQIDDGVYDNVIITFRKGSMAECLYGKVQVKNEKINTYEMYLKFEDGSYEKIRRKYRFPEQEITIVNGMSKTMVTIEDELITILFVKKIKPKKKSYIKAPDPDFDF